MSSAPKTIIVHGDEGGPSENESATQTEAPPSMSTEPAGSSGASHPIGGCWGMREKIYTFKN